MTGLAALVNTGTLFYADEYGFMEAGSSIERMARYYGPNLWVGWERYTIDVRRPQTSAASAIEMIGVARRIATLNLCRILPAAQQHTPKPVDRERLRAIGWWLPGKKDAQSAACHLLSWLQREGEVPPREREILGQLSGRVSTE